MYPSLPANSKIVETTDGVGYPLLKLPYGSGSFMRYPVAAFLIFWLCGWCAGWIGAFHELFFSHQKTPELFLLFWLGGWTIGGGFALAYLYRLLRPSIPETLTLARPNLIHDSGVQPLDIMSFNRYAYRHRQNAWKKAFQRRKVTIFSPENLATLKIRDVDGGNRLTIDQGNERFDLGESLTEVEREWLFERLKGEYGL